MTSIRDGASAFSPRALFGGFPGLSFPGLWVEVREKTSFMRNHRNSSPVPVNSYHPTSTSEGQKSSGKDPASVRMRYGRCHRRRRLIPSRVDVEAKLVLTITFQIACIFDVDMLRTCLYVECMTKMIQVRNVPEDLHRLLKSRAALAGKSLSEYLLEELRRVAARPTLSELAERISNRESVTPPIPPSEVLQVERESR